MSAVQTSGTAERYYVSSRTDITHRYMVLAREAIGAEYVDSFQTRSAAEYFARLLNSGLATINHHAVIGCRVEVK